MQTILLALAMYESNMYYVFHVREWEGRRRKFITHRLSTSATRGTATESAAATAGAAGLTLVTLGWW